jgi:hypothetical protein
VATIRRLIGRTGRHRRLDDGRSSSSSFSSSSKTSSNNNTNISNKVNVDQSKLKWTEREEAPKWLQRMAPSKGDTKPPDAKFLAVFAVVGSAGYYAWFIDPPQEEQQKQQQHKKEEKGEHQKE